jgi:hypothetical protein
VGKEMLAIGPAVPPSLVMENLGVVIEADT